MKKNFFDKMVDSYENFHLKESEIDTGNKIVYVSPKLKLALGWSLFALCCILTYILLGSPFGKGKTISQEDKKAILEDEVDVEEEHDTIIPYEKDADKELNEFIEAYFTAITACDNEALQDMVTDPTPYRDDESLKKKAEFITGYNNITVYTKEGLDESSYIAFVVANLTISGVNSSPYDIITLYIQNGARGYLVNNGTLSDDAVAYIERIRGDKDIQKVYKSVEKKNEELKADDPSLKAFYDIINNQNAQSSEDAGQTAADTETPADTEASVDTEAPGDTEAPADNGDGQSDTDAEAPAE